MSDEIKNAIIESVTLDTERGLSAWLTLDYGGSGQGFGGFMLYVPKDWTTHRAGDERHTKQWNYAGHFIYRCIQIAGVEKWEQIKGKTIRARIEGGLVRAIGHIVNDDWFEPAKDFEAMKP